MMNNGVVRDRDNNFSRHQTFKDGVTIEGGLTVDITGGSNAEETADFTAEVGKVYVVDTSSTAVTATLPASPAALEEVTFMDGAKTFNSNALTVNMNGKKLDGATVSTKVHTTKGGAFKYIYRNATYGWLLKAFVFMLFALNIHAGDFTYEMNSWEQDSGLSIGTDKLKPRTAGGLLSIADSAGTTVATITTSAMTITTGSIGTLDVSTSQIGTLSLTNALTVSNGGTGLSELAAGRIPYGAGTGALGSSQSFFYDSVNIRLGIGTDVPTDRLSLSNNLLTGRVSEGGKHIFIYDGGYGNSGLTGLEMGSGFGNTGTIGSWIIRAIPLAGGGVTRDNTLAFLTRTAFSNIVTEHARFSPGGNFGIGTTAPAKKLEVLDTAGAQARLSYTAGSAYADFTVNAGGDLAITPSGAKTTFTTVAISGDYLASTGAAGITTDVTADGIVFRFVSGLLTAINP